VRNTNKAARLIALA